MRFIAPERLYWIAALLPVAAVLVYAAWRRRRELKRLFADPEAAKSALRLSRGGRSLRVAFVFLAMLAALAAAARPYFKTLRRTVVEEGRDVAVVFDVSKSMWARDLPPSRLEHAKYLLRELAGKLPGDRLSLIAFAGSAYLACPLTSDPAVFGEYVDELDPELVQRGGTDLEAALRTALKSLKGAAGTQAIVVLTDGDELTGSSSRVVEELQKRRIPLVVIGLGDPTRPAELPDASGNLRKDRDGKVLTSALNEASLKRLAAATGGVYIRSTVADPGAAAAAARLAELAPAGHGEREQEFPVERFDLFVALAFAFLALALVIPERPLRRMAAWFFAFSLAANAAGAEPGPPPAKTAAELYNRGVERHRAGDAAAAAQCYEAVLRHADRDERARAKALFNLGAMDHGEGRKVFAEARELVEKHEIDPALQRLEAAEKHFDVTREFYRQSLGGDGAAALTEVAPANLTELEGDAARVRQLKAELQELKKQRRQARQSARNAQQQNQQQQQQKQSAQPQQQPQQNQPQQGAQQQQNQQQQSGASDRRQAARQAARESEKLEKQARRLGQKELEEKARRAAENLRKAEEAPDPRRAQKHLDDAVKELGAEEEEKKSPDDKRSSGEDPKKDGEKSARPQTRGAEPPREAPRRAETAGDPGQEQLLRSLDEDEREQRRQLRRRFRRPPVEKDW